jgi:hypothetical protein
MTESEPTHWQDPAIDVIVPIVNPELHENMEFVLAAAGEGAILAGRRGPLRQG